MAGGRKKERHTGRVFGLTWLMGSGPQDEFEAARPHPLEVEAEEAIRSRGAAWSTRMDRLQFVDSDEEMDETFAGLNRRADAAAGMEFHQQEQAPRLRPTEPPEPGPVDSTPASQALQRWRHTYRDEHSYLLFLKQFEPTRYTKALTSIDHGRGAEVAEALTEWYAKYRSENGWD